MSCIVYLPGMSLCVILCAMMVAAIYLRTYYLSPPSSAMQRVYYDATLAFGMAGVAFVCLMYLPILNKLVLVQLTPIPFRTFERISTLNTQL